MSIPKASDLSSFMKKLVSTENSKSTDGSYSMSSTSSVGAPVGTVTTTTDNSGTLTIGSYAPLGQTVNPNYMWTTDTVSSYNMPDTVEFKKLKCKLPEGALEKLMTIGLIKSKKVLKQRIEEAFTKWCNTQELDVSVFPMLLAACVLILKDENETTSKEEK